jgi:group I intron endonuclease
MNKKFNYVYITTNLINNKQYIGDHSTNNLNDKYLGSGVGIKNAIKIYGKENFKREILEFFCTKQESFYAQEKYINEYKTLSPNGYNNSKKGGYVNIKEFSQETRNKIGLKNKGKIISEEHKQKIKDFMKTFKHSEETKQKLRKPKTKTDKYAASKIGSNNPMYKKSLKTLWIEKYGEEEAEIRYKIWTEKIGISNKNRAIKHYKKKI